MAKARIFNVLKILLYCLGFPLFIVLAVLNAVAISDNAPGYSFWPFVGPMVIAFLGIIYLVIGLIICRKKSKRTIVTQTVAMSLIAIILVLGVGLVLDKVLPDIYPQGDTFYYKDAKYKWLAQSETQGDVAKEFVRRNLMNGNLNETLTKEYDGKDVDQIGVYDDDDVLRLDYYYLSEKEGIRKTSGTIAIETLGEYRDQLIEAADAASEEFDTKIKAIDLADEYVAEVLTKDERDLFDSVRANYVKFDTEIKNANDTVYNVVALNYVLSIKNAYDKIIRECVSNEGVQALVAAAFPSIDDDGYQTFLEACLLDYANSGRQTVPVLAHVILDRRETYSTRHPEDARNYILYDPKTGTTAEEPIYWSILDMDGGEGISIDLSSVAAGEIGGYINMAFDLVLDKAALCNAITEVVQNEKVAGAPLYVSIFNGDGYLEIVIRPSSVSRGVEGYQRTAWLDSNGLLLMLVSIISTRDLMSSFAAIIAVTTFLAGMCRITVADAVKKSGKRSKKKKGKKDEDKAEDKAEAVDTASTEVAAEPAVEAEPEAVVATEPVSEPAADAATDPVV